MAYADYSGQPFDAKKKREEILGDLQDRLFQRFRRAGAVPMTSEVTRILPPPATGADLLANVQSEVTRAYVTEGPRFLDRHSTSSEDTYRSRRFDFISGQEGINLTAYDDRTGKRVTNGPVQGNVTVGVGFNMDRSGARETWKAVFGDNVSFDDVRSGKTSLSNDQAKALFEHDMMYFEGVVSKAAGGRALTENQRLALVSIAYNTPSRVAGWANVIQSGDDQALTQEILYNSFAKDHPLSKGLQSRRYREAALFGTISEAKDKLPTFSTYQKFDPGQDMDVNTFKSKHYTWQDFRNDRFQDAKVSSGLVGLLDTVSDQFGGKLKLTSGYRSPDYNAKASFSGKDGPHTHGYAADIDVSSYSDEQKRQLVSLLVANGARGVGHYSNGSIHVDLRPTAGKGPGGLALWWNKNEPYTNGQSWFAEGVDQGLTPKS